LALAQAAKHTRDEQADADRQGRMAPWRRAGCVRELMARIRLAKKARFAPACRLDFAIDKLMHLCYTSAHLRRKTQTGSVKD